MDLLLQRHVKVIKHRQRKGQNNQIQHDLNSATNEAELVHVNGGVSNHLASPAIPKEIYGPDLEDHAEGVCDSENNDEYHKALDKNQSLLVHHKAEVKGEDGSLAEELGGHIKGVAVIENLPRLSALIKQ